MCFFFEIEFIQLDDVILEMISYAKILVFFLQSERVSTGTLV